MVEFFLGGGVGFWVPTPIDFEKFLPQCFGSPFDRSSCDRRKKYRKKDEQMKQNPHKISVRMTDDQFKKLQKMSEKMGYTSSELLRKMIDNANDVTMMQNKAMNSREVNVELKKIAEKRYQNSLLRNLANNMNQVAHYVNKYKNNSSEKALLLAFQTIEKQVKSLKEVIQNGDH